MVRHRRLGRLLLKGYEPAVLQGGRFHPRLYSRGYTAGDPLGAGGGIGREWPAQTAQRADNLYLAFANDSHAADRLVDPVLDD